MSQDLDKTAEHWSNSYCSEQFSRREWLCHPLAQARLARILGGHATHAQWFHTEILRGRSVKRALGVGVGIAYYENQLLASGAVQQYDYYDVSQTGLDLARAAAEKLGVVDRIRFFCADISTVELQSQSYDVITFMASLHHIHELHTTLANCNRALTPGGILWANEYVGPDRFAYPAEHADIAKRLFRILDQDIRLPGEPELKFPTPEDVIAVDPSEAVHSSEILSAMRLQWPDLRLFGQYGTLAFMLMWCLNHNGLYDTVKGYEAFGTILDLETALIDSGALPHYFVNAIARKPPRRGLRWPWPRNA